MKYKIMMKSLAGCVLIVGFLATVPSFAQPKDKRYFELRIYYAPAGKLDPLIQRFRNHSTKLLEKHGMENIGYWVPETNPQNALYYILAYPDRASRDKSWDNFFADPAWKKVQAESEAGGKLVDSVKSVFMYASDLVPAMVQNNSGKDKVYELRIYTCFPGRLPNLVTRFKEHTLALFEQHQIHNVYYFTTDEKPGVQPKLAYFVTHENMDAAKKSWDAFRNDPAWVKVRDDSEKDGKIVEKIEATYLIPLNFSKLR